MIQAPFAWRSPSLELAIPAGQAVVLLRGRPVWNDSRIRFDSGGDVGLRNLRSAPYRCRNTQMSGEVARAAIACEGDVEMLEVSPRATLYVREEVLVAYDGTLTPYSDRGEYCSFRGQGRVAVAAGREFASVSLDGERTLMIAYDTLRAWQGDLAFSIDTGGAAYKVTGTGTLWWAI